MSEVLKPTIYILVYDVVKMTTESKLDVVHIVGYPEMPTISDLKHLKEELDTDPEFLYLKQITYSMMFCNSGSLMDCIPSMFVAGQEN